MVEPPINIQPQFSFYNDPVFENHFTPQELCSELATFPTACSLQPFPQLIELFKQMEKIFNDSLYYRQETVNSLFYSFLLRWYNAIHYARPTDARIIQIIK